MFKEDDVRIRLTPEPEPAADADEDGLGLAGTARVSRRNLVLAGGVGALALALAAFGAVKMSGNGAKGQLEEPAGDVADRIMQSAVQTASDVRNRAIAGEGIVRGVVCIDAGHGGGYDLTLTPIAPGSYETQYVEPGGASGVVSGVDEAQITLQVSLLLRDRLQEQGVTVVMVREDDSRVYSSEERAVVANECGADLFIRLHCDGSDYASVSGFSTLVPGYNEWTADICEQSMYAAQIMHPLIVGEIGANDMGIVERTDLAGFNFCDVPVVLYEMGFLSNPEEDVKLNDPTYQELLAQAICDGAVAYLEAVAE